MRFITSAIAIIFLTFSFTTSAAAQVNAEGSVENRTVWLENATSMIESGDFEGLEASCKRTLGSFMHRDVEDLLTPLRKALDNKKAIYVDKVEHIESGRTFDQHIYAAYYGERQFVFYSFTFARLENGWQLYAIDFADSLAGLNPASR